MHSWYSVAFTFSPLILNVIVESSRKPSGCEALTEDSIEWWVGTCHNCSKSASSAWAGWRSASGRATAKLAHSPWRPSSPSLCRCAPRWCMATGLASGHPVVASVFSKSALSVRCFACRIPRWYPEHRHQCTHRGCNMDWDDDQVELNARYITLTENWSALLTSHFSHNHDYNTQAGELVQRRQLVDM